jgi:hypothetical protein
LRSFWTTAALLASCGALAASGWAACSIYDPSLLLPAVDAGLDATPPPPVDATPGPDVAPSGDADTCAHRHWPARPASDDPSSTPSVEVIDALATLDIGVEPDGGPPPPGFDLDGVCTCPGPDSCRNTDTTKPHCDDDAGGDNSGGGLLRALGTFGVFNSTSIDQRLAQGYYGLLVDVRNWNGQPNDTNVSVAIYVSNGLDGIQDAGAPVPPKNDGNDHWTVDPNSLLGGTNLDDAGVSCDGDNTQCTPFYFDDNAYVAGGVLVGSTDFPISLGGVANNGTVVLDLSGSVITAQLVQTSVGWSMTNGLLAGRWSSSKLLSSLAALADPLATGSYLCGDDPTYQGVKAQICQAADITADPKLDSTGAPCDALSVAFAFTAVPAHLGQVYDKGKVPAGCVGDAGEPFHDQCP